MQADVRYCATRDGVRIGYASFGSGEPLLVLGNSPAQFSISVQRDAAFIREFARHRRLILFDGRGIGLSQRGLDDYSVEARILDLEAVADACHLDAFDLLGPLYGGPTTIAYAAKHPHRVNHLILVGTFARGFDVTTWERFAPLVELARTNWRLAWQVLAGIAGGHAEKDRDVRALYDESMSGEDAALWLTQHFQTDVRDFATRITSSTLVLHHRKDRSASFALGQDLAARIPGAHFVPLDDSGGLDAPATRGVIEAFLRDDPQAATASDIARSTEHGTAIILFADIVDSTALTEQLGDATFRAKARELDQTLRNMIAEAGGTAIDGKLLGDGVLATFPAAAQGIAAALACASAGDEHNLRLHLGLHAGDVIREDNNVFGGAVNIAARISGLSAPGEVLVSDIVRGLARTSAGVVFEDRGEHALKGVGDAQRVYAVRKGGA